MRFLIFGILASASVFGALTKLYVDERTDYKQGASFGNAGPYERITANGFSGESFVITTRGPDQKGLVARITAIIARHQVNITNCQAVFKGGDDPNANIMIYEVDIPTDINHQTLRRELREKALALNLDISIQHKLIFEAINRV